MSDTVIPPMSPNDTEINDADLARMEAIFTRLSAIYDLVNLPEPARDEKTVSVKTIEHLLAPVVADAENLWVDNQNMLQGLTRDGLDPKKNGGAS